MVYNIFFVGYILSKYLITERKMKMSVVKVIEILAESKVSWEDATQNAINEAAKSVDGIKQINIENLQAVVENNKIVMYRIDSKISFLVSGQ